MRFCAAAAAAGALCALSASAQEDWQFPNPLQEQNMAATCQNFDAMLQQADPEAMQALAGQWQAMSVIPGTPGLMPDTPIQLQIMNYPNGTFEVQRYGCFTMQSVPGMPSLGESCSTSMLYGQFAARFVDPNTVVVATMTRGTHFTGAPIPPTCGIAQYRFVDGDTLVDQGGNPQRRVRN